MLAPTNPYATPSDLPHQLPPFDRIRVEHHRPALEAGMAEQRAEVEAIATDPAEPTFANTVEALERSGRLLARAANTFFNLTSSVSSEQLRAVESEVAPLLAAHSDAIHLDPRLFARIDAVRARAAGDAAGLDAEQRAVLERYHTDFVRAGAALGPEEQQRLRALNEELSALTTAFGTHLLEETNALAVLVEDAAALDGLSPQEVSAAAQAARARGHEGGHLLPLALPTAQPVLASLRDRDLRERVHTASVTRGARGGEHDTRALVVRIAALRAQRSALLGFPAHADWVVADQTAGSRETVMTMLTSLVPAATSNARGEQAELTAALHADGHTGPLRPWDWAHYAERVRRERFAVDAAALRPYFPLDAVLTDGVFWAAQQLYGLELTERTDLPVPHPDVRVWEVRDEDGRERGLFLGDFFARESKRGGAWMSTYVDQSHLLGTLPVVVVTLNVPPPAPGEPALLSVDEVDTAFHEFGHALHGLLSDVRHPRLSGTTVPRDFVEYPSQVNEFWAWEPVVLARYARHHATGEALPGEQVERLRAAQSYGQGHATTEILAAMLLDQAWHQLDPAEEVAVQDVEAFEAAALERFGVALEAVPPRYRSTYFNHVFGGGYSAGYYSYLWSEVLDADTVEWFREHGGLRRANGAAFAAALLSRGGTVDPMAAYAAFRGRGPRIEPLLERRGLTGAEMTLPEDEAG
ncbi:M3 family metallopeptidase [Quadrisphaera sp. DSM 44207]|uniref:M3 family metallopeptidase n=1 Tax=Quadrisphaera sp. DSM 44207 TaxID=1881057 RepID=UPI000B826467|nr:M3 family metallopeptidase [Quadrisphaera sp. DSM 44207]